jgi:hypothetical protein
MYMVFKIHVFKQNTIKIQIVLIIIIEYELLF